MTVVYNGAEVAEMQQNNAKLAPSQPRLARSSTSVSIIDSIQTDKHPLVRKKSGELLKSSLKLSSLARNTLPRVMSTPALKSVRFAARLANIKMFDGTESPSAVLTNDNSPVRSPEGHRKVRLTSDYFQMNDDLSSDTSDDEPTYKHTSNSAIKYTIARCDVPPYQPFVSLTKTLYLQSLRLEESSLDGKYLLTGLINCANLGFEKHLMIKFTSDNWRSNVSFSNQSASVKFHSSFPHVNIDQFQFKIPINDLQKHAKFSSDLDIQLCIQYTVNDQVFWDSNGGKNYHVLLKPQNTIKTYTYQKSIDDYSQFDVLVTKLMNVKNESAETLHPADASDDSDEDEEESPRKTLHSRYNFGEESLSKQTSFERPQLKQSFLVNDINPPKARYSQSYRNKKAPVAAANFSTTPVKSSLSTVTTVTSTPSSASATPKSLASLSYTDLLANYCFSGGNQTAPTATAAPSLQRSASTTSIPKSTTPGPFSDIFGSTNFGSSCSPASTFHSFSDSIHI